MCFPFSFISSPDGLWSCGPDELIKSFRWGVARKPKPLWNKLTIECENQQLFTFPRNDEDDISQVNDVVNRKCWLAILRKPYSEMLNEKYKKNVRFSLSLSLSLSLSRFVFFFPPFISFLLESRFTDFSRVSVNLHSPRITRTAQKQSRHLSSSIFYSVSFFF
jgi:hypothetical protein